METLFISIIRIDMHATCYMHLCPVMVEVVRIVNVLFPNNQSSGHFIKVEMKKIQQIFTVGFFCIRWIIRGGK